MHYIAMSSVKLVDEVIAYSSEPSLVLTLEQILSIVLPSTILDARNASMWTVKEAVQEMPIPMTELDA